jgi:hypothetical protein
LVVTYSSFKKISFSLKTNHVHPFEGILNAIVLRDTKREKESVCNELDVLRHQVRIHTNKLNWQGFRNKFLFDFDCAVDNLDDSLVGYFVLKVLVKQTCEVGVHTFISRD